MTHLEQHIDQLQQQIERSVRALDGGDVVELMSCSGQLVDDVLAIGQSVQAPQSYADFIVLYRWMPQLKAYAVLLRNVCFNLLEGNEFRSAGIVGEESFRDLANSVHGTLQRASDELKPRLSLKTGQATSRELERWKLEQSPWSAYEEQFILIGDQIEQRRINHDSVMVNVESIKVLRARVYEAATAVSKRAENIMHILSAARDVLSDADHRSIETITQRLKDLEEDAISADDLSMLSSEIDPHYLRLSTSFQQLSTIDGSLMLAVSDVNLQSRVQRWLESEVIAYLHEASNMVQLYQSDTLRALANARNRVQVAETDPDRTLEEQLNPVVQSIAKEYNRLDKERQMVDHMLTRARVNLHENLTTSALLEDREAFLEQVSDYLPSGVDQRGIEAWGQFKSWFKKPKELLTRLNQNTQLDISMTVAERLVQFLRFYTVGHSLSPYTSIFRIKGFIGDSFITGRDSELARIETAIEDWRSGYRGTLCIKGDRYSGKSLLGELIATRYFTDNVIRLKPGEDIRFNGRTIAGSYDLKKILEEIRKYTITRRYLIWIDDLELWRNRDISVLDNCKNLNRHMDQFNARFFYAVSMSNHFWTKLEQNIQVRRAFQTVLTLTPMSSSEIWEAIRIRHSATHHQAFYAKNNEQMSMDKLKDQAYKIARFSRGNIGDALLFWAGCAENVDTDEVFLKAPDVQDIPEFLELDTAIVLHTIIEHRQINEYALRQLFGQDFSEHYIHILRRLLSVGILHRHADGALEITDIVGNKIGRLLENFYPLHYSG